MGGIIVKKLVNSLRDGVNGALIWTPNKVMILHTIAIPINGHDNDPVFCFSQLTNARETRLCHQDLPIG